MYKDRAIIKKKKPKKLNFSCGDFYAGQITIYGCSLCYKKS